MKHKLLASAIATVISATSVQFAAAEDATSLTKALSDSDVKFNLRYRYEAVDDGNTATEDAGASTLRSRLTLTSQKYNNLQVGIELDNVSVIGDENHNSGQNGMGDHAKVVDPESSEINQAWVAYTGLGDTTVKAGRQRVNLDNQRFIGGVAWRQNEQTHDAVALINKSIPDTTVLYAYVHNVNTIVGSNIDTDSQLLNINYAGIPGAKLSLYRYEIEVENDTTGIRLDGKADMGSAKFLYELELATQEGHHNSNVEADYSHIALGLKVDNFTAKLGVEELGAEDSTSAGFSTALGTKHKFNGWADKFLATPVGGLEDTYLSLGAKAGKFKVKVVYHDFDSAEGSADLGKEWNVAIGTKLDNGLKLLLKGADYSAGDSGTDTTKIWLQAQYAF